MRILKKPKIPKNSDGRVMVHIGCGQFNGYKYINIDSRPFKHVHYVDSIENFGNIFSRGYIDLIYASHVIEHVSYLELPKLLKTFYACLKNGGILRVSVPDFKAIVSIYTETGSIEDVLSLLLGGQGIKENFHYGAFDKIYLNKLLLNAGFREIREWDPGGLEDHKFKDWSGMKMSIAGKEWPISLNLEAIK
jgi:SAM-dependent methyltransferase